jgi:catechol 2,3-dioxygenase-like lactoylglutathione lyase family enzyme
MQPRITLVTLGVSDLPRSNAFYNEVLGWSPFLENAGTVMYLLNGMILSLFPQSELMKDAAITNDAMGSRFSLAQCLSSTQEVDALFAQLKKGGVHITKMPELVFLGRT